MRASGTHRERTDRIDLIELLHVREAGHFGLLVIAPFEHLLDIHLGDPFRRLFGVVVVLDINHKAVQKIAESIRNFHLELFQFTGENMFGDVVVRKE